MVGFDVADERPIQFQALDRQQFEVGERRIAGTEIIDGQRHAQLAQAAKNADHGFGVLHGHGLGDFKFKIGGTDAMNRQQLLDPWNQVILLQLAGR